MDTPATSSPPSPAIRKSPWAWVPSLYVAQGIPYVVVMTVSVIMYKRLGISNTDIALYTSWLYLPWVIKPLWSPVVELFRTKRFWITTLQFFIGAALASVAVTLPLPAFFQATLAVFWLMAFASATHDIAADGFYMLALEEHQQAAFSGVRSTFYRIAMITGQGLLVVLAGQIETSTSLPAASVTVQAREAGRWSALVNSPQGVYGGVPSLSIVAHPQNLPVGVASGNRAYIDSIIAAAKASNIVHGFSGAEEKNADTVKGWWERAVANPLAEWVREHFGETELEVKAGALKGNVWTFALKLTDMPEGEERRVATVERTGDKNLKIIVGENLLFTQSNVGKEAIVVVQTDPNLKENVAATFAPSSGKIALAWSVTFVVLAALFILFFVYHRFMLPRPAVDRPTVRTDSSTGPLGEFFRIFKVFFKKKNIVATIAFLLLYRFAEAQLVKLVTPFLLDARDKGGLGLTTSEVGIVYGTVGIIALTAGGLLGGYLASRQGLKFWLWPMVFIIHLPDLTFVYLSQTQPESFLTICAAVAVEQFGYGFGFTAYMLYMILVAEGEHKTAHYAICTGFMALGMMVPGMFSGWLQELVGYQHFFIWIILSTIPGFFVAALVKIPKEFGRKKAA